MVAYSNLAGKHVLSYSKLEDLHSCPRKFELLNVVHANPPRGGEDNIDFMFGHMVGTGIQMLIMGLSLEEAIFYASLEYKTDIHTIVPRKKKSFWHGIYAIESAAGDLLPLLSEYEVFNWTDEEGIERSGCETHFQIELEDGQTVYEGHIDLLMQHKVTGVLKVFEIKTNAFSIIHEATYSNSTQVEGYSLFTAALTRQLNGKFNTQFQNTVDVTYIVFKVPSQEFELMPMQKSYRHWLKFWTDTASALKEVERYRIEDNYPRRGGSCYEYFRPCFFFNQCHYPNYRFPQFAERFDDSHEPPVAVSAQEIVDMMNEIKIGIVEDTTPIVINMPVETDTGLQAFDL